MSTTADAPAVPVGGVRDSHKPQELSPFTKTCHSRTIQVTTMILTLLGAETCQSRDRVNAPGMTKEGV